MTPGTGISRIGVVIPAHNEAATIEACLVAVGRAAEHPDLRHVDVLTVVVLDSCTDATDELCSVGHDVARLSVQVRNVGAARSAGFAHLVTSWGCATDQRSAQRTWFASTDADTVVGPDWIAQQLHLAQHGADAVFGVVDIDDWAGHSSAAVARFYRLYANTMPGTVEVHTHVHGANLGVRASAYMQVGGFNSYCVGEDQDLSDRLDKQPGLMVVRTAELRVKTSARTDSRAPGGFGDLLASLAG